MQSAGFSAELKLCPFQKAMKLARMWSPRMEITPVTAGEQSDNCQCIWNINPAPFLPQYDPQSLVNHVVLLLESVEHQAATVMHKEFPGGPHFSVDCSAGLAGRRWAMNCRAEGTPRWGCSDPICGQQLCGELEAQARRHRSGDSCISHAAASTGDLMSLMIALQAWHGGDG